MIDLLKMQSDFTKIDIQIVIKIKLIVTKLVCFLRSPRSIHESNRISDHHGDRQTGDEAGGHEFSRGQKPLAHDSGENSRNTKRQVVIVGVF